MPRGRKSVEKGFSFFSEIDLNDNTGEIKSDMPAWFFDVHIEELEENIARKKRMLKEGLIDPEVKFNMENELNYEQAQLAEIERSRPRLSGEQKDACYTAYQDLGKQLRDVLPTRKEDQDGLVNPRELLKIQKDKHITMDIKLAKACGVNPVNGKVSGDEASKCYSILGKALGENTSVERLRRDGGGEAYKTMHDLTQAILGGREIKGV